MSDRVVTFDFLPDWSHPGTPFRKTWSGVGNIDQFRWLVREDVRRQLAMARDEIGLRYVRACAMYGPEMRVHAHALRDWHLPPHEKSLQTNWQLVDYCIEGLVDLGLKPVYTTCFTPAGMTSNPASCWPDGNLVTPPDDLCAWAEFVTAGLKHHIRRFGREEVRSWLFECWNEPNLTGFFNGPQEDFFRLWSATWHAVKAADPSLRIGGPSTARGEWIPEFLDWTVRDGTAPDYLITHVYNNDSESEPLSPFDGPASHRVKDSPHFASGVIRGLRRMLDERGWTGEVHWNEWGRSWFPHDPLKETALEAAFVVKTMSETSQDADAFAFWCLSDIYDQCGYSASEFDGNYGMLSLHGLRKPAWHAHQMLMRLGALRIPCTGGDGLAGITATRSEKGISALLHAYPEDVTNPVEFLTCRVVLPSGIQNVELTRVGNSENNIVSRWRDLGSPDYPTRDQLSGLAAHNRPLAESLKLEPDGSVIFSLERPGVALLTAE